MRYDMPAIYVDQNNGFKYITFQSPIPKGSPMWQYPLYKNVDDFSHVTSQYLASLDPYEIAWLLPPFNEDHMMIDDIGLQKIRGNCLPPEGVMLDKIKEPLEFYYIAEDVEGRFDTSLVERLRTTESNNIGYEEWEAYNVYTQPNHYTEFVLPDQETTREYYDTNDCSIVGYSYTTADGNEYLITSSLIAPNSDMNLQRSDICKKNTYEHEIFSALDAGDGGTVPTQFAMIIDGSGSINSTEWDLMLDGIYNAVQFNMPHDGSVEFTVVQFADYIDPDDAKVEVGPVIVTEANHDDVANQVLAITHMYELTPLAAGINVATQALLPTASQYTRHVINIVTDGGPNVPIDAYVAAEDAIANMVSTLGLDPKIDEIDVEGISLTPSDFTWMRDNIVWPQPGDDTWPPTKPGWIRSVSDYQEFSDTIAEKFDIIFIHYAPRLAYEFDANDGTGIYINSVVPPTYPPTASACSGSGVDSLSTLVVECGYTGNCEDPVIFNGGGSHDNDENGEKIVTYQWNFGDGATGTGKTPAHIYSNEGTYTVTLTVTDDEGEQDTDTAYVDIYCDEEPPEDEACVSMGDVDIDCGNGISYAYLRAQYITDEVGSGSFHICFDSDEVHVASVDQSDFDTPIFSWNNTTGDLFISGLMSSGNSLTGDFLIARIGFVRVDEYAEAGSDLTICASELLTDDPSTPVLIDHTTIDGYADINCDNPSDGDMNGDGFVNSGDIRYIAIYVASGGNDPNYKPLHADGDVNNDHDVNSGDIRYLAIYVASGGMDPDYSPLYP
jgi:PKD repeat protein